MINTVLKNRTKSFLIPVEISTYNSLVVFKFQKSINRVFGF